MARENLSPCIYYSIDWYSFQWIGESLSIISGRKLATKSLILKGFSVLARVCRKVTTGKKTGETRPTTRRPPQKNLGVSLSLIHYEIVEDD
jgi:hypothetical protein